MSWHHGDWLAFSQAVAAALAIFGAFGVVFYQNRVQRKQKIADDLASKKRALMVAMALGERAVQDAEDLPAALRINLTSSSLQLAIDVLRDRRATFERLSLDFLEVDEIKEIHQMETSLTKLISLCRRIGEGSLQEIPGTRFQSIERTKIEIDDALEKLKGYFSERTSEVRSISVFGIVALITSLVKSILAVR